MTATTASKFVVGDRVRYLGIRGDSALVDPILKQNHHPWVGFTGIVKEVMPSSNSGQFAGWCLAVMPEVSDGNLRINQLLSLLDGNPVGSPESDFELI